MWGNCFISCNMLAKSIHEDLGEDLGFQFHIISIMTS